MPVLHQKISPSEILQRHSINSLLDQQNDILSSPEGGSETMSVIDMFGLNSPRGLLDFANSPTNGLHTPPTPNPPSGQFNNNRFEEWKKQKVCSSFSSGFSPASASNFYTSTPRRSCSLSSDSACGNSSPLVLDHSLFSNASRSNTPESESSSGNASNNDGNISDLLSGVSLNDVILAQAQSLFNNKNDVDIGNLQQLQTLQALLPALGTGLPTYNNQQWNSLPSSILNESFQLDRAARFHRSAASVYDATCTWSGVLPPRTTKPTGFSSKVFLGGVPWDISEQTLMQTFKQFGPIRVEWPGKDKQVSQPKGYVYIIFESEKNVRALLQACTTSYANSGNWYFKISSKRMKSKQVQVIPWFLNDSNCTKSTTQKLDPTKTVFVGALHGMLNAEGLAKIMNDLFDGVVYTGIDTDKYKYPIGSGRVTFNNPRSYMKAVTAAFIEIKTCKFTKKVQVDPYLEDSLCSVCGVQQGPYFCRETLCFRYFCRTCWQWQHTGECRHHKPLMRNSKNSPSLGMVIHN